MVKAAERNDLTGKTMKHLYFIRHGRQNSGLCNVDVPLSEEGHRQAGLLGERLSHMHIDAIYTSDLIRAAETAREIERWLHLDYHVDSRLREIDFGDMTGHSDADNQVNFGFFLEKNEKMQWDLPYPGGECYSDVYQRGMPAIWQMIARDDERILIVTHGGFIRAMLMGMLGADFARCRMFGKDMENCSITEILYDEEKNRFYIERFNDYAHLESKPELLRKNWKKEET